MNKYVKYALWILIAAAIIYGIWYFYNKNKAAAATIQNGVYVGQVDESNLNQVDNLPTPEELNR